MENTFITIATFNYSSEAHIIKGKLESEGIKAFLADDFTIDVDPMLSNAAGGVKIKVHNSDKEKALDILKTISEYCVSDTGGKITCPKCSSNKINYFSTIKDLKSLLHFLLGFLISALPFYIKYKYRCENCNTEFDK